MLEVCYGVEYFILPFYLIKSLKALVFWVIIIYDVYVIESYKGGRKYEV